MYYSLSSVKSIVQLAIVPITMLFNKEPVPIFVQADKTEQNSEETVTCNDTDEILVCLE